MKLEQGYMTLTEYQAYSLELTRHVTYILDTEYQRVCFFMRGLGLPIRMATQRLVFLGRTFAEILDYARVMEVMHRKGYDKSPIYKRRFGGIHSSS